MKAVSEQNEGHIRRISPLLSVKEAAAYLGKKEQWCSRTLRRFIPLVKIGGSPMYRKDDIDQYIQSQVKLPMDIRDVKSTVSPRSLCVGTVFARKNSDGKTRWYVCVTYHGQRYREVAGEKKSVAQKRLRELEDRLDRGEKLQDPKVPFDVVCDEYLEWALVNLAPRTRREREIVIKAHLKPFFTCLAGEIGVMEIERYKASRDRAGIAGITLNTELKTISGILRFGVDLGYLLAMPKIRRVKVSTKKPRGLSKEEIFKVLDAARPDRRPMLQLMIFTGLRKGELAHLEWSDIDFENRVLHVQPKSDWTPKGGDHRSIPLNNHGLAALRQAESAKERRGDRDTVERQ